ncbi:MAG TPA: glycine oxidase ThiO [Pyrinomonadaceae bacterium]|jgi:glycine oxidase|nr:glycine oxidase ThiO [Pyrinomonadaceae bacterium]
MRDQESLGAGEWADAIIIGGGVIGLAVARALAGRGLGRVVLIERARLGAEASHAAAGMLAAQAEASYGADALLRLACASRDLYPPLASALLEETGISIELERTGTLYLAFTEEDEAEIEERYGWQKRAGLNVEQLTIAEARRLEPAISPRARRALRFPLDAQVENRRLVAALAAAAERLGVRLITGTNALALRIERERVTGVETSRGRVSAPVVVVAGGAWSSFIEYRGAKHAGPVRVEPVRGQMLCFEANPRPLAHVVYSPRGYIVPRLDGRLLAGSTTERAGFDKSVTGGGIHTITGHAIEIAPLVGGLPLMDAWAGLRPRATADELPVIGGSSETGGLYYATAHYRNGILLAPITGELVADEIASGTRPPLLKAFTPDRFTTTAAAALL